MCFPGIENCLRTDDDFKEKTYKEHHVRLQGALESDLNIRCVSQFPIDYMHCVLLGVTRQLLTCLLKQRKQTFSLKSSAVQSTNENLKRLRKCLPFEFPRKQRTFKSFDYWKATELRMFLCYTSMAAFHYVLEEKYYSYFLLLVCANRILCNPIDCSKNNVCASQLLQEFVIQFEQLYGKHNVS